MTLPLDERAQAPAVDAYPLVQRVALYVTLACNLRCGHCYVDGSPAAARLDQNDRSRLVALVASLGKPVDLTGGEPFMVADLARLVGDLVGAGARVSSVFTNATLLTHRERMLHEVIDTAGPLRWYVSLDGDERAHDALRGHGSFTAALEGADRLRALGQQVFVNTMLHAGVDTAALERLHDIVDAHGFARWRLDSPFNAGAWTDNRAHAALSTQERIAQRADVVDGGPLGACPSGEAGHVLKYLDGMAYSWTPTPPTTRCPCRTFPWPNADVSWCQDLSDPQFVVGNLLRDGIDPVYDSYAPFKTRTVADVAASNGVCSVCDLLSFCGTGCRVGALGACAGVDGPDPGACRLHTERLYQPVTRALHEALARRAHD